MLGSPFFSSVKLKLFRACTVSASLLPPILPVGMKWHYSMRQRNSQKLDVFVYLERVGDVPHLTDFIVGFPIEI